MKSIVALLALVLAACATRAEIAPFSYASSTPIGAQPALVEVAPSLAVAASGAVDLRQTNNEQRSAAAFEALGRAQTYAQTNNLAIVAAPLIVNRLINAERWEFEVMLPVATNTAAPPPVAGVLVKGMPSGLALAIDHNGSVATLQASYDQLSRQAPANIDLLDLTWEQYLTDPTATAPVDQRTRVFRQARAR